MINQKILGECYAKMGLLGNIIAKGVATAATNSIIKTVGKTVGDTTVGIIGATAQKQAQKEDAVIKNGTLYIKPTRSSEDYLGESAFDVVQELLGVGFESVTLKPIKKLSERAIKKYGNIKSISINGNNEFLGIKRVPASSHIIIDFLDFKEDVSRTVYTNVRRLKTGKIQDIEDLEYTSQKSKSTQNILKSFCPYCGEKVLQEQAKFCSSCGKEIN